jgi:hypothetical protein
MGKLMIRARAKALLEFTAIIDRDGDGYREMPDAQAADIRKCSPRPQPSLINYSLNCGKKIWMRLVSRMDTLIEKWPGP